MNNTTARPKQARNGFIHIAYDSSASSLIEQMTYKLTRIPIIAHRRQRK